MFTSDAWGDHVFWVGKTPCLGDVVEVVPASVLTSAVAPERNLTLNERVIVCPTETVA